MRGALRKIAAGCCCAVLAACGAPADDPRPTPSSTVPKVALPKPDLPWDEEFAAQITLERVTVGEHSVLLPKGIRLPDNAEITAATEATVVLANEHPSDVRRAVAWSCGGNGYVEYARYDDVTVWVGHGMAVRLEARHGAQVLAWAPESQKDAFANSH